MSDQQYRHVFTSVLGHQPHSGRVAGTSAKPLTADDSGNGGNRHSGQKRS